MRGLLADVNVQRHVTVYLRGVLQRPGIDLWELLTELNLTLSTFEEVGLPLDIDDRTLWEFCQEHGWVLFTDNRNAEGEKSLEVTLRELWHPGQFPVLTVSDKTMLKKKRDYFERVAVDVAELLFGIEQGEYRYQPRIYVPLR